MTPFAQQLGTSLMEDDTEANRREWADRIIRDDLPFGEALRLVLADRKTAMRFLWLTGGLCDRKPEIVAPHVAFFFEQRHTVTIPNYDRSLAKLFSLAGIPEQLEGAATTELFGWLLDPKISVSTKSFALAALYRLSEKYPELREELKVVIEDQLDKNSVSFRKQALKIVRKLE